jgi:putative addiction module component (TIGR02574 family)
MYRQEAFQRKRKKCRIGWLCFPREQIMTLSSDAVTDAALALPEKERARLVERLLETLSPQAEDLAEEELLKELDRRRAELHDDPSQAIPWSDVVSDN